MPPRKTAAQSLAQRPDEPRFSRQAPEVRRQQILDAAIRCLAKGGAGAFTVSQICAEAGISHGLINHYFSSKEALLVAIYGQVTDRLASATREVLARGGRSPEAKLAAVIETSFSPSIFEPGFLAVWLALWAQVRNHEELRRMHAALYDGYRKALARVMAAAGQARGRQVDASGLALGLTALIDGLWLEWCLDPAVFSPEDAKAACHRLLESQLGPLAAVSAE